MFRRLIFLFLVTLLINGCDGAFKDDKIVDFDSSKMDALSITNDHYRKAFIEDLYSRAIEFEEMNILDGEKYIVTWKTDQDKVDQVYKDIIGTKPGKYSKYFSSKRQLDDVVRELKSYEIVYRKDQFYGLDYLEWEEPEDDLVKSIIKNVTVT